MSDIGWIKTLDKLPDDGQWCVVYVDSVVLDVACYDDNLHCWQGDNFSYKHGDVKYWLALPELPEGIE
ncbi:DUF551 domain-containing protein [Providencia rettgeri]|uniref:DUF551 domain-containing protein n=1 Tax=Providencia rettgeri TaxID=587 RepID=UPI001EE74678|nr:DUF551 domain-containing protein [Providencia rettgeri]MCG5371998.1 DUF551 domain-containing protein [Providencia rettgeri]